MGLKVYKGGFKPANDLGLVDCGGYGFGLMSQPRHLLGLLSKDHTIL